MATPDVKAVLITYLVGGKLPDCLKDICPKLQSNPKINWQENAKIAELTELLKENNGGIPIFAVYGRDDFAQVANFLTAQAEAIRESRIRPFIFDYLNNPKVSAFFRSKTGLTLLDQTATAKALMYKIQQNLQIVEAKLHSRAEKKETGSGAGADAAAKTGKSAIHREVVVGPSLADEADYWLISKADVRNVLGRWLIEMVGPSANVGSWVVTEVSGLGRGYEWAPRKTDEVFHLASGKWVFFGQIPEFNWNTNRWKLVGDQPQLVLIQAEKPPVFRIAFEKPGKVLVAENSAQAKSRLPAIEATFEMMLKKDGKSKGGVNSGENSDSHEKSGTEAQEAEDFLDHRERAKSEAGKAKYFTKDPEKKAKDWNENITEDEAPRAWNDQLTKDESAPREMNAHNLSDEEKKDWGGKFDKKNIFNSGQGITQGHGDGPQGYSPDELLGLSTDDDPDKAKAKKKRDLARAAQDQEEESDPNLANIPKGEAAFVSIDLKVYLTAKGATLLAEETLLNFLESGGELIVVESPAGLLSVGDRATLKFTSPMKDRNLNFSIVGVVSRQEECEGTTASDIAVRGEAIERLKDFNRVFEQRQNEVVFFMQSAKGY